jgi:hypothetical protein
MGNGVRVFASKFAQGFDFDSDGGIVADTFFGTSVTISGDYNQLSNCRIGAIPGSAYTVTLTAASQFNVLSGVVVDAPYVDNGSNNTLDISEV